MTTVLGADLGTSTITVLALDAATGDVLASRTVPTPEPSASAADRASGFVEFDPRAIVTQLCDCLCSLVDDIDQRRNDIAGLCLTGQQHGVALVDSQLAPLTPFINWQDRRGDEQMSGSGRSWVDVARDRLGADAAARMGCRLATGYAAVSLFWMTSHGRLPGQARACFITNYVGAFLTGERPVTDPTMAASSGVFDLRAGDWDAAALAALGLPRELLPEIRPSASVSGRLTAEAARLTALPTGLPILVGLGDNQASFLGSVADPAQTVLVNVGTGGQVSVYSDRLIRHEHLETRPYPLDGYLLVSAGLCGGRSYALLEQFFRRAAIDIFGLPQPPPLYETLNRLAASVASGAIGLRCEPYFTGTRAEPQRRGLVEGISPENFTPAHLARALLEGMAAAFRESYDLIVRSDGVVRQRLVCSGNGMRENPLLVELVSEAFHMHGSLPPHREEAAYGAACLAASAVMRTAL